MVNFKSIIKTVQKTLYKNSPEILTGIGITGMIITTITAVKVTPKALKLIEEKKKEENKEKLTAIDTIQTAWKCYIPTAITGIISTGCLIGAASTNARRNAALAAAYALSETAFKDYKNKVIEVIGEKKEQAVKDAIAEEKLKNVSNNEIIFTNKGETLCYDAISGRYFKSDMEKLRKTENDLNRRMRDEMYISLNDFYNEIGLPNISIGEDLGWNIEHGYIEMDFSSQLTEDGTPCLLLSYVVGPKYFLG